MSQGLFVIRFFNAKHNYSLITYFGANVGVDPEGSTESDYKADEHAYTIEQLLGFPVAYDYFFVGFLSDLPPIDKLDVGATFRNGSFTFI